MTGEAEVLDRGDELTPEVNTPEPAPAPESAPEPAPEPAPKAEDKPRDEDGKFIPKGVFDNRLRSEREAREAAERRAQELEARLGQVSRNEDVQKIEQLIVAAEKMHAKLLLDGEHEKAAETMRDIRLMERQVAIQQASHMSTQAKDQAREEIRMELAIERLEASHPELNPQHESYNQELVDDVIGWQQVLIQRNRLSPSVALAKAVEKVMSKGAPVPEGPKAGLAAASRKDDQITKNLATDKAQPPSMKDAGMDSDKTGVTGVPRISDLTPEQYDALPESTKAKLRGDVL
jgi:hypothetical protein